VPLLIKALPICINEVLFQSPLVYTVPFILQHNSVYAYCKNQINANHEIIWKSESNMKDKNGSSKEIIIKAWSIFTSQAYRRYSHKLNCLLLVATNPICTNISLNWDVVKPKAAKHETLTKEHMPFFVPTFIYKSSHHPSVEFILSSIHDLQYKKN